MDLPPVEQPRAYVEMMADGIGHRHEQQKSHRGVSHAQKIESAVPPVDLRRAPSAQ
jgi:hypothetical protein